MSPLVIGVLDERAGGEQRVALVPDTARRLVRAGMAVSVQAGAGEAAWYPDRAYSDAGATVGSRREVLDAADVVVMVGRPGPGDLPHLRRGQVVAGVLGPRTDPGLTRDLAAAGVSALSLDLLPRTLSRAQSMDVLSSQAAVAGYKAVLVAADAFGRYFPMLITAAGTSRPAGVLVLGAGVAGLSAIGTARRLGAVVTGYDVRPEARGEVESMGARFLELASVAAAAGGGGYARALSGDEQRAQQAELSQKVAGYDVVVTTAQVPGRRPPLLVSEAALGAMRPGSVVVDLAAGPQGGNVAGSVPDSTVVTPGGVTVVGAANLASRVPTAASDALSQNMAALLGLIVRDGALALDGDDEVLAAVLVAHGGRVLAAPASRPGPVATKEEADEHLAAR